MSEPLIIDCELGRDYLHLDTSSPDHVEICLDDRETTTSRGATRMNPEEVRRLRDALSSWLSESLRTTVCEECGEPRGLTWIEITIYDETGSDPDVLTEHKHNYGFCSGAHATAWMERASQGVRDQYPDTTRRTP